MIVDKRIKKHLEKYPKAVKKAKSLFGFKYPKLLLLILSVVLAYFAFNNPFISSWVIGLKEFSYIGIFIAGMFIAFGFSAPFAIGFFIILSPSNLFLSALIGGIGASLSDFFIFKFIRFSFMDEFNELKSDTIKEIKKITHKNFHLKIKHYILYVFAGIIIATPLPDEFGVALLAGLTTINVKIFALVSFFLHAFFILLILLFF